MIGHKHTQKEAEDKFQEKGLRLVGKYINVATKVETECPFCKKIFLAKPASVFIGDIKSCGCHNFSKLTQEEVEKRALEHNIKIVGKYIHSQKKIECICPLCQSIFLGMPYDILRGKVKSCGCIQNFLDRTKLSQEEAKKRSISVGIRMIGEYKASYIKTEFECPDCKYHFLCEPKNIWNKHIRSCGSCKYHNIKVGNKIGKYTILKKYRKGCKGYWIEAQCDCGKIWIGKRSKFAGKGFCKKCGFFINGRSFIVKNNCMTSKPAIHIQKMINNEGIHNYRIGIYSIDIALARNNNKIAIEYDEWYWHGYRIKQDRKKAKFLTKKGWKVLRIQAHNNLPTQKQLDKALHELIFTNRKRYTITLKNWGIGKTRFDNKDK